MTSGIEIHNQAVITFDPTYGANPPIVTNEVLNTLDLVAPTSRVATLPASVPTEFAVSWNDDVSGVAAYTVYLSVDGGNFTPWLTTSATTATYSGQPGHTYAFYRIA